MEIKPGDLKLGVLLKSNSKSFRSLICLLRNNDSVLSSLKKSWSIYIFIKENLKLIYKFTELKSKKKIIFRIKNSIIFDSTIYYINKNESLLTL